MFPSNLRKFLAALYSFFFATIHLSTFLVAISKHEMLDSRSISLINFGIAI